MKAAVERYLKEEKNLAEACLEALKEGGQFPDRIGREVRNAEDLGVCTERRC